MTRNNGRRRQDKRATSLAGKLVRFVSSHVYNKDVYVVYQKRIGSPHPLIRPGLEGVSFAKLEAPGRPEYRLLKDINRSLKWSTFRSDIESGHECFVGKGPEGKLVLYVWTRRREDGGKKPVPAYKITDKREVHVFSAFTASEHRGKNLYPAALEYLESHYGRLGYLTLSCTVRESNPAALRAIGKLNFAASKRRVKTFKLLFFRRKKLEND